MPLAGELSHFYIWVVHSALAFKYPARWLVAATLLVTGCAAAPPAAAPPRPAQELPQAEPESESEPGPTAAAPEADPPLGIVMDDEDAAGVFTHLRVSSPGQEVRFAVVADRTGGMQRGVFADVIPKLNALHPDLVLSVGDLIPGYTADRAVLTAEWDEFDALVRQLDAPFFYVAGNHDVEGEVPREVWRKRYGRTYYAFVYAKMLFVCLDTVDPKRGHVGEGQLAWLEQALARHERVTWTFLLMHIPLWEDWSGLRSQPSDTGVWKRIAGILGDRPYTAFAGHHHRYVRHEHRGRALYTLATTGGGHGHRGPEYGEFDHIAWVTTTEEGPRVVNLDVTGILSDAVRTPAGRVLEDQLVGRRGLLPTPIYFDKAFRRGTSTVSLRNDAEAPVDMRWSLVPDDAYGVVPAVASMTVEPHETGEQRFEVAARSNWVVDTSGPRLAWRAKSVGPAGEPLVLTGTSVLPVVRVVSARRVFHPVTIDGRLSEWGGLPIAVEYPGQILRDVAAWHGPNDSHFRLGVTYDTKRVHIAVEVFDDFVDSRRGRRPWDQDGVEIRVDARVDPARAYSRGAGEGRDFLLIAMSPSESPDDDWLYSPSWLKLPEGTELACVRTKNGYVAEIAIPRSWVTRASGGRDGRVRLNVAVNDRDADGSSSSWWWPDWRTPQDLPGSGTVRVGRASASSGARLKYDDRPAAEGSVR